MIATKSSSLPQCTNNKAEALALLFGLELAKSLYMSKIHVEGDSSIIINACIKHHVYNWSIQYILHQVWSLLDSISECYIMHTYREGNLLANCLANLGTNGVYINSLFSPLSLLDLPNLVNIMKQNMFRIRLCPPHFLFDSKP